MVERESAVACVYICLLVYICCAWRYGACEFGGWGVAGFGLAWLWGFIMGCVEMWVGLIAGLDGTVRD